MNKTTDSFKQKSNRQNKNTHSTKNNLNREPFVKEKTIKKKANPNRKRRIVDNDVDKPTSQKRESNQKVLVKKTVSQKKKKRRKLTPEQIEALRKKRQKEIVLEVVKFITPILILAILVFYFILNTSSHMVDGSSMNPTLKNEDRVIVTRTKNPNRYDVITFVPPVKSEYQYVKRIIGMPGDLISTDGQFLFINHQAESMPEELDYSSASELPDGTIKVDISDKVFEQLSSLKKIPDDYYFVLGDNRNNSSDSREFGLVSRNSIEGIVSYRFYPFKDIGRIR